MPPRKRQRTALSPTPSTNTPTRSTPAIVPTSTSPAPPSSTLKPSTSSLPSPTSSVPQASWTPAQETDLFKALIRFKPTGLHKHFHMLCVSSFLRSHGHTLLPPSSAAGNTSTAERLVEHTRIPAIWAHLSGLYDLEALDERENVHSLGPTEVVNGEWVADGDFTREFGLPGEDGDGEADDVFAGLMWERRFPDPERKRGRGGRRGSRNEEEDKEEMSSSPPIMEWTRDRKGVVVGRGDGSPIVEARGRKGKNARSSIKAVASPVTQSPAPASKGRSRGRRSGKLVEAETASPEGKEDDEAEESAEAEDGEEDEEGEEGEKEGGSGSGEEEEEENTEGQSGSGGDEGGESDAPETSIEAEDAQPEPAARGTRSNAASSGRGTRGRGRGRGRGRARK